MGSKCIGGEVFLQSICIYFSSVNHAACIVDENIKGILCFNEFISKVNNTGMICNIQLVDVDILKFEKYL